jgi:hypothetical protein
MTEPIYGISTPFTIDRGGKVTIYNTVFDSVRQAILNILMTRKGERVMRPDFGTDALSLVFEGKDDSNISLLRMMVFDAIQRWEPRAIVNKISGKYIEDSEGLALVIEIYYTVRLYENVTDLVSVTLRS